MRKAFLIALGVVHLLLVDAVTKELAVGLLKGSAPVPVVPGFFDLAYVENVGCAWGMLQGCVWPLALFAVMAFAVIVWKRDELFETKTTGWRRKAGAWAEALLYAGITGNLLDRVLRGHVIDFLDFHWADAYHFPCFNAADVYITVAAGLLVLLALAAGKEKGAKGAAQ